MTVDPVDRALLAALESGLPVVSHPYRAIGAPLGLSQDEVIARLKALSAAGVIKRFGVVVRHRALGFTANAMVVWDVPDTRTTEIGQAMAKMPFVTLCYRRPRRDTWPYNLFCMIHGRERAVVHRQIAEMRAVIPGLAALPFAVLFSTQAFKQRGARYGAMPRPVGSVMDSADDALDDLDRRIINALQGGFPVTDKPFAEAASWLETDEATLIERIARLRRSGWLSRFGPMFNADRLGGATTLAAMAVPDSDFERVAAIVNDFPEVAHNYARDHALNMWFVVATDDPGKIAPIIARIEALTGLAVFDMQKLEEFFVEARFAA